MKMRSSENSSDHLPEEKLEHLIYWISTLRELQWFRQYRLGQRQKNRSMKEK